MSAKIVVAGSLNADLTIYCDRLPNPGETLHGNGFAVNPGGKSANQAVAAARLGGQVTLLGAVGLGICPAVGEISEEIFFCFVKSFQLPSSFKLLVA